MCNLSNQDVCLVLGSWLGVAVKPEVGRLSCWVASHLFFLLFSYKQGKVVIQCFCLLPQLFRMLSWPTGPLNEIRSIGYLTYAQQRTTAHACPAFTGACSSMGCPSSQRLLINQPCNTGTWHNDGFPLACWTTSTSLDSFLDLSAFPCCRSEACELL